MENLKSVFAAWFDDIGLGIVHGIVLGLAAVGACTLLALLLGILGAQF